MANDLGYTAATLESMAKKEVPEGFRLARIIRKNTKETPNAVSQAVFVPAPIPTMDWMQNETIAEWVQVQLQGLQDKVIRAVLDNNRNIVTDTDLSLDSMVAFIEATDENIGRISKESITEWYNKEVSDTLTLAFADKLGISDTPTDAETTKLNQLNNQYLACFQKLAGKNLSGILPDNVVANLEKALDMIPVSGFGERMRNQLAKVKEVVSVDMLAL